MVKRILKIVGIVLASFVVIVGGAIGVVALTGGFKEEYVEVTNIYFDNNPEVKAKQILTFDDVVANLKCEPANATNPTITLRLVGEKEDNKHDNGVVQIPSQVKAGEDFTIKVHKDSKGNNIGGVVNIEAKCGPLAVATIQVVVDVSIPDDVLYFTGSNSGKLTTSGKNFTMAISSNQQYVYLKSSLVNAFYLQAGNKNLKNTQISYVYYRENGSEYERKDLSDVLQLDSLFDNETGLNNYFYTIPIVTDEAGYVEITARTHRTSTIEEEFNANGFAEFPSIIGYDVNRTELMRIKYNEFLNKYIEFFDNTEESYKFFKNNMNATTNLIELKSTKAENLKSLVEESFKYVFVECSAVIDVTSIKLDNFTSIATPKAYNVFDSTLYSVSGSNAINIKEEFELAITTDNDGSGSAAEDEKDYMFESLTLKPYLYLDATTIAEDKIDFGNNTLEWEGKTYKFKYAYGFEKGSHIPITQQTEEYRETVGYLLYMEESNDFLNITTQNIRGEKHWRVSCNVPLPDMQNQAENIVKALYIGFEVVGLDSNGLDITKETLSRIYINYTDIQFADSGSGSTSYLTFNDLADEMATNVSNLTIDTSNIDDDNKYKTFIPKNTQKISVDMTDNAIANLDTATYTNVMYFVEKGSNSLGEGDSQKVVAVGRYNFINYQNLLEGTTEASYYKYGEEEQPLVGQRIPTYTIENSVDKVYYLQALNSHTEPVKVFAVVYLADKDGFPIDINGRRLVINEKDQSEESTPSLVVIRMSALDDGVMPTITINSYVENINFYTKAQIAKTVGGVDFTTGFINRNSINYYMTENGEVSGDALDEITEYLKLKLLKDNYFELFVTNLEISAEGEVVQEDNGESEIKLKNIFGEDGKQGDATYTFVINTVANKQHAFNALCADLENYTIQINASQGQINLFDNPTIIGENGEEPWEEDTHNAYMIRWYIHSSKSSMASGDVGDQTIYLNPSNSSIPYSSNLIPGPNDSSSSTGKQLQRNNFLLYNTNKLEIYDVVLGKDVKMQNDIIARLKKVNSSGDKNQMEYVSEVENGYETYTLELDNGEIEYSVLTNLLDGDSPNLKYVDCSQAGEGAYANNENTYFYNSVNDYVEFYVRGSLSCSITYTATEGVISFGEDYTFTNLLNDNSYASGILFGRDEYAVDGGYININGYKLKVDDLTAEESEIHGTKLKKFTIRKGEIFPLVDSSKALIYNVEFPITSSEDNINFVIKDYVDEEEGYAGAPIKIYKYATITQANGNMGVEYDVKNYLDDYSTTSRESAITKIETLDENDQQVIDKAYVNFMYGEHLGEFVLDSEGKYKKVVNSQYGNEYTYELIGAGEDYDGDRYALVGSNRGVPVYLMITFGMIKTSSGGMEYTFHKAIQYNVLQSDIDIVMRNGYGTDSYGNQGINSASNPLIISGGEDSRIYLNSNVTGAVISIGETTEQFFFDHVTFDKSSTEIKNIGIEMITGADGSYVLISVPDIINDGSFGLTMTYPFKGVTKSVTFNIEAKANVQFATKEGVNIDTNQQAYSINLDPAEYSIFANNDSIFKTYFALDSRIEGVELSGVDGDTITLQSYTANYGDDAIAYKSQLYDVTLILDDCEIKLNYKLKIVINPIYVADITQLSTDSNNPTVILNNESLFENYIKLYDGDSKYVDISNGDARTLVNGTESGLVNYKQYFTFSADAETLALLDETKLANGIICLKTLPSEDTTLTLEIMHSGLNTKQIFYVKVLGLNIKYNSNGGVDSSSSTWTTGDIDINISGDTNVSVGDYILFESTSNNTDIGIVTVLVDGDSQVIDTISKDTASGTSYKLAYAKTTGGSGIVVIEITDINVIINNSSNA